VGIAMPRSPFPVEPPRACRPRHGDTGSERRDVSPSTANPRAKWRGSRGLWRQMQAPNPSAVFDRISHDVPTSWDMFDVDKTGLLGQMSDFLCHPVLAERYRDLLG